MYDKLLKPRQSFRITLYLTAPVGPFWTSKLLNQVSCFRVWNSDFLSVCQLSARFRNGTYVPFISAVGPHAVCITDRIIMHLPNCIKLCERAHLGHAWRVPPASTYVANKTLSISARVRTHNILRVRTTIRPYPWEIVASFFLYVFHYKSRKRNQRFLFDALLPPVWRTDTCLHWFVLEKYWEFAVTQTNVRGYY